MIGALDSSNNSALRYNEASASIISKICEPLFTNFGITIVVYSHFFNNGSYLDICTDAKWQQHYIAHFAAHSFIAEYTNSIFQTSTQYVLWDNNVDAIENDTQRKFIIDSCSFDIWHGFSIYKHHKDSLEAWHFATTRNNPQIVNFYINHLDLLNRFILYFQDKAASFLDTTDLSTNRLNES